MAKAKKTEANEVKVKKTETEEVVKTAEGKVEKTVAPKAPKFTKKQFVQSRKFAKQKDLLNALLKNEFKYSIKEVEDIIHNFLYGKK